MPRHDRNGGRKPNEAPPAAASFKQRIGALKNIPAFVALVWRTSPC
jgi:hypothetical protein